MKFNRLVLVAVVGSAIAVCAFVLQIKRHAGQKPHPAQHRLLDLTESSASATFVVPEGELFDFVIGVPESADQGSLQGTLVLLRGSKRIYERAFSAENLKPCNWLAEVGLKGYIISWPDGSNELDTVLQPGEAYEVQVSLGERPALPVSLWLTHLQTFRAYQKSRATN
jgi:hypothetical protein